jgi:hypothetical protein
VKKDVFRESLLSLSSLISKKNMSFSVKEVQERLQAIDSIKKKIRFLLEVKRGIEIQELKRCGVINSAAKNPIVRFCKDEVENLKELVQHIEEEPTQEDPTSTVREKNQELSKEQKPEKLVDLFGGDEALMNACVDVLKRLEKPILYEDGTVRMDALKGGFVVWVEVMSSNILKLIGYANRKQYAEIISSHFPDFSIDESLFDKPNGRAHDRYKDEMMTLLSQVSQERKNGKFGK